MDIVTTFKKRLELAKSAQRDKFELFGELDEIYHVKGKQQEGEGQLHMPESRSNIETIVPRMVAQRPTVVFKPRPDVIGNREMPEKERQVRGDKMQATWEGWWDKDGAFIKNVAWVKGAQRHGTKHVRTYWKTEKQVFLQYKYGIDGRPVPKEGAFKYDDASDSISWIGKPQFEEEEIEVTTFDDACVETVSNYDLFIDPEATDVESAAWILFRFRKTVDELRQYGKYSNLNKLSGGKPEWDEEKDEARDTAGMGPFEADSTIKRVTCYEMWQKGSKGIEKCTIAEGIVIESMRPNPFRHGHYPFIKLVDHLNDDEYWGTSGIEMTRYQQYAMDTLASQDIDNRTQILDAKVKADGEVSDEEILNSKIVHTNTKLGDDFSYVVPLDMTRTSQEGIASYQNSMDRAWGVQEVTRGEADPSNQTASGMGMASNEANRRFELKIQLYEEALKELAYQVVMNYQQFKFDYWTIRRQMPDGSEKLDSIAPEEISGFFDVEVESGSSQAANKELERQQALQVYQLNQDIPDHKFQQELRMFVLDKFPGAIKVKEALKAAFERQAQQQEAVAAQQQAVSMAQDGNAERRVRELDAQEQEINAKLAELGAD